MGLSRLPARRYGLLAALTLALAAFNLGFRIDREVVTPWDEALYATSAAEMAQGQDWQNWLVTTYDGAVDYYNAKPPLNVWLITAAFKTLGVNLVALRLPSLLGAFAAIVLLQWWCWRAFGAATALLATVVLSTTFSFLYVHSARSGNPDALFAFTVLLAVVVLWASRERPWRLAWLGPIVAAAFLLKGTQAAIPVLIAIGTLAWNRPGRRTLAPLAAAVVLCAAPVLTWAVARWRVDGSAFFRTLLGYDLVDRTTQVLEGHPGSPVFYLHQIQKDQYDWLVAGLAACVLLAVTGQWRRWSAIDPQLRRLLLVWAGVCLLVPTLMSTKLPWYVNPFYPLLALTVAAMVVTAMQHLQGIGAVWPRRLLATIVVFAFALAEGKLVWYSYNQRDLRASVQGLMLSHRSQLAGTTIARRDEWDPADKFVARHLAGATPIVAHRRSPEARTAWWLTRATNTEPVTLDSPDGRRHTSRRHRHEHVERVLDAAFDTGRRWVRRFRRTPTPISEAGPPD